jgi:hypothetical protein
MHQSETSIWFAVGLVLGMLALLEAGRRIGRYRLSRDEEKARAGMAAVEGAVFGLMGLLVAFTFSGAATRFDARRQLIIEEANAIGTAWLRLDLLPAASQPEFRELLRRYLDTRLEVYRNPADPAAVQATLSRVGGLQGEIWKRAVAVSRESPTGSAPALLLLPALNDVFDIATTRTANTRIHPPSIIFFMLGGLALMCALLAGYAMAGSRFRSWVHVISFALVLGASVYVILDLEFPRLGLIRVDAFDQVLLDVRASME